jgi:hypothetical protein
VIVEEHHCWILPISGVEREVGDVARADEMLG